MTVNSYLHSTSSTANLSDLEKASISRSISTLQTRLNSYFSGELTSHFVFGSYSRTTILPRSMDEKSDVDYMVVFSDGGYQPQTYLDKLRRFANYYYSRSEITQSHPTIKLTLNHIRFELVPALLNYGQYTIPTLSNNFSTWETTDPTSFKANLEECNKRHNWYAKPTIRLMKYWNAQNGRPFDSYWLEQQIVDHFRYYPELSKSYWVYFEDYASSIQTNWAYSQWKNNKIDSLKRSVAAIESDLMNDYPVSAENKIERLLT